MLWYVVFICLISLCWCQNTPMVNADDVAKADFFMLSSFPQLLSGLKAKDIFAGGYQSALISEKGESYYWGLVGNTGVEVPTKVEFAQLEGEAPIIETLSLGGYHILAVDVNGRIYSMGRGESGVLGHGEWEDLNSLKVVAGLKKRKVNCVAAGYAHSVALTDTGIFTWGGGARGALGTGATKDVDTPKLIKPQGISAKRITQMCTGGYHTALLNDEGEVFTFGGNSFGALGLGHKNDVTVPTLVKELSGIPISYISCGGDHTLALSRSGDVYSWGWGEKGQLGTGRTEDEPNPHKIDFGDLLDGDDKITSVTAGGYATSFAITEKGRVFAFGWGEYGILGNGGKDNVLSPVLVPGLSLVKKIATGYKHALALTRNGDVYVFGEDVYGSLGLGGGEEESEATVFPTPTEFEDILPNLFGTLPPSPPAEPVDPGAAQRNATINAWKTKGLSEISGLLVYSPYTGFGSEKGSGRAEVTLANGWAVGASRQSESEDTMEDYAIVIDRYGKIPSDAHTQVLFGVYDGHNGKHAADFVAATFHKTLLQELQNTNQTTEQALTNSYEYTNLLLKELSIPLTGTTALTCLSVRNATHHNLFSSNVGDTRAVLSRGGKAIRLSYDHQATDEAEADRVKEAGGSIINNRVDGVLAITRALGDTAFSQFIISTPYISKQDVLPLEDEYLILASDGLWDVVSDQEAVELIGKEQDAQKASKVLLKAALERGSQDDITIVVARVVRPLFLG